MIGDSMTPESAEMAMRQLSTKVLVRQPDGKKRMYPVNYKEEVHTETEHEQVDEEQAIIYLA